jgi:uncharacterized protein (TIGR02466 family)
MSLLKRKILNNSMLPFAIKDDDDDVKQSIDMLFSTPVRVMQIDKGLNKKILAFVKSKYKEMNFCEGTGGNNISIDENFLDNDELGDIKQVLTDYVNEYFKEIVNPDNDNKLHITISWINITRNGESHDPHTHTNSIVSAILYVDTCEEDTISFTNPRKDMFGNFNFSQKSEFTTDELTYPATTDRLIIFPSTLRHRVEIRPNTCKGVRISLSFNTWVKGTIGATRGIDHLHFN